MKTAVIMLELSTLLLSVSATFFLSSKQQSKLVKRADIFYRVPDPHSERPAVKLSDISGMRNKESLKLVIHGYFANMDHISVAPLRNAYLSRGFDGLLIADWRDGASLFYTATRYLVKNIGVHFARVLDDFLRRNDISPAAVHIIGHSLGAHVGGVMGKYFNGTIGRITGLDPAGPLFNPGCLDDCLTPDSAMFVDVIHTGAPTLGDLTTRGHADFFPYNGVAPQPGCDVLDILTATSCSHYRAPILFAESVRLKRNFPSVRCSMPEIRTLQGDRCLTKMKKEIMMMGEGVSQNARGIFYLETSYVPPYGFGSYSRAYG